MELTVYFKDEDREPLTLQAPYFFIDCIGKPGHIGMSTAPLAQSGKFSSSEVVRIESSGHPVEMKPEPPQFEDQEMRVTPESFVGVPSPRESDNEPVILTKRVPVNGQTRKADI